ncbi:hypothetical protein BH10ACT8_BH10ACT8_12870 [soil metagenome]|jgi:hypothetical protein
MKVRRVVAASIAGALAAGAGLLLGGTGASATTPPTPVGLLLTGMTSTACPLPLNGALALSPGTAVKFTKDPLLGLLGSESLTIKPAPDSTDPKTVKTITDLGTGQTIAFTKAAKYQLSWTNSSLVATTTQKGTLTISTSAQKCVVAVQVPTPSVSVPGVPPAVTSPINGVIGGVVGGVNSAVAPVNGALGPVLGSVNQGVGGVTGGTSSGTGGGTGSASGPSLNYKPSGLTVADRTVPKGYGSGSGLGGNYIGSGLSGSRTVPAIPFKVGGSSAAPASSGKARPGQSSVDLASNSEHSAITGIPALLVLLAVIALSTVTAFYARTFLLHRPTRS